MCMHGCLQHVCELDGWYNGRCHRGCLISSGNARRTLWNMEGGTSRSKSLLCMDGVRIGADGGRHRRRRTKKGILERLG